MRATPICATASPALYGPRVAKYQGAPRVLKEVVEAADRCLAFRHAKAAEIAAAFKAPPPHG